MLYKVIIVSALSLSLRDKERLREREIDREIERAWQNSAKVSMFGLTQFVNFYCLDQA